MVQFTDLPTDIVDQILTCLPDFHTLAAAIKVSKAHTYVVFKEHRQTILTSVAVNLVGPSLVHALRVALCRAEPENPVDLKYDESLGAATSVLTSLTSEQRIFIEDNIAVIQGLEDLYSQTYKDRHSRTSTLNEAESLRFRNALYRMWLLCLAAGAEDDMLEDDDDDEDDEWQGENRKLEAIAARLVEYSTDELLDIIAGISFLRVLLQKIMHADPHNFQGPFWSRTDALPDRIGNPALVYEWVQKPNSWKWPSDGFELFATTFNGIVLDRVCSVTNLEKETLLAVEPQRFVTTTDGVGDICFGCNKVHGVNLYGRANWHLLGGVIGPAAVKDWLPGNLSSNTVETSAVAKGLFAGGTCDWVAFAEGIFDCPVINEDAVWDKEQWYCTGCMTKLFKARFPRWWMARPKDANASVKDDCWYGWNCRTQIHKSKLAHAKKLNHFCEPVRDDGRTPAEAWAHN